MTFKGIDQEQHISVDIEIRLRSFVFVSVAGLVGGADDELGGRRRVRFRDCACSFVDLVARMKAQDCCIGFGIGWEALEFEGVPRFGNALGEGFELVALEWSGVARIDEFDDDARVLDAGDAELVLCEGGGKRRAVAEGITLVEEGVPAGLKGHRDMYSPTGKTSPVR